MEDLEEDLTCAVCYGLFSDPRVLSCSHTFCRSCLESVLVVSGGWRPLRPLLKCPSCRSVTELPSTGLDALPANVCLRAIVEKFQRDSRPCAPACAQHPREPLNVYCVQDRVLICGLCLTVGQHHGHEIDDLQTALLKERSALVRLTERCRGQRWEDVCGLDERLREERSRTQALLQKDRELTAQFFQGLKVILAQKEEQVTRALERAGKLLDQAYEPLAEQVKGLREQQEELMTLGSSVESEERPLVFLEKVHQLRERVTVLDLTPLPSIPCLQLTPRIAPFFHEHWSAVSRALTDRPVPEISCVRSGIRDTDSLRLWLLCSSAVILLLAALVSHSLGFLWVPALCPGIDNISTEVMRVLHDAGTFCSCQLQNINMFVSTLGQNGYQQLLSFFKT